MQNWSLYCDVCFWNWLRPKLLHPSLTSKVSVPNRQLTQTLCTYHIVIFVQKRWWLNGTTRLDDPDLAPKLQRTRVLGKKPWNNFVPVASQYLSTIIIPFILHNKLNLSIQTRELHDIPSKCLAPGFCQDTGCQRPDECRRSWASHLQSRCPATSVATAGMP